MFFLTSTVSGMYLGEIIGFSLSGVMVDMEMNIGGFDLGGWPSVFYIFGFVGVLWFPFWALRAYDTPGSHPYITKEELAYIMKGIGILKLVIIIYIMLCYEEQCSQNYSIHSVDTS